MSVRPAFPDRAVPRRRSPVLAAATVAALAAFGPARSEEPSVLVARGDRLLDLARGIEWQRCALGQKWTTTECAGTPMTLSLDEVPAMIRVVDPRGREGWRLPTRDEFASLGCRGCARSPMAALMPGLVAAGYWTGDANAAVSGRHWSIDLGTFRTFGRNEPSRRFHVILVRDR